MAPHFFGELFKEVLKTEEAICHKFFDREAHLAEKLVSMLGARLLDVALFILALVWIAVSRTSLYFSFGVLILCVVAVIMSFSITRIIRKYFHRTRPFEAMLQVQPLVNSTDHDSFPSDHAAISFCVAVCIGVVQHELILLAIAVASTISLSRFFARLHYPTDILAGAGIGAVVGAICSLIARNAVGTLGI